MGLIGFFPAIQVCGFQAKIHRNKSLPFVCFVFMWNMYRRKLWSKRVFFSKRVVALSPSVVPKCQGILKQITFGITVHPRNFNIDTKHDGLEGAGIGCHGLCSYRCCDGLENVSPFKYGYFRYLCFLCFFWGW